MIAVTPASIASCGPSANGKNASEAKAAPSTEERVVVIARSEQHLHELPHDRIGKLAIDAPVQTDDAAEGRERVGRESSLVCLQSARGNGDAAGIVVLDDHARRNLELRDRQPSRI